MEREDTDTTAERDDAVKTFFADQRQNLRLWHESSLTVPKDGLPEFFATEFKVCKPGTAVHHVIYCFCRRRLKQPTTFYCFMKDVLGVRSYLGIAYPYNSCFLKTLLRTQSRTRYVTPVVVCAHFL